jgi:hypothetical protein
MPITRNQIAYWHDDVALTRAEAAAFLCVRTELLEEWATLGCGPSFSKPRPKMVRYRLGDLRAWLWTHRKITVQRRGVRIAMEARV